jgi:hypothetical protein
MKEEETTEEDGSEGIDVDEEEGEGSSEDQNDNHLAGLLKGKNEF